MVEKTDSTHKKKGRYRIQEVIRAAEVYAVVQGVDAWVWVSHEENIGWCDDYHIAVADLDSDFYLPPLKGRQLIWHSRVTLDRASKRMSKRAERRK